MSDPETPEVPNEELSEGEELSGDEVYQPHDDGSGIVEDAALMDPLDTLDDRGIDPALDEGWSPPEKPLEVDRAGVTAAGQRRGESLDERLAEEVPEGPGPLAEEDNGIGDLPGGAGEPVDPQAGRARSGRLVAGDQGLPLASDESADDVTATDAGIAGGAASAEEAAVHTVPDLPDDALDVPPGDVTPPADEETKEPPPEPPARSGGDASGR